MKISLQYYSAIKTLDYKSLIQNENHIHQRQDPKVFLEPTTGGFASSTNATLPISSCITFQKPQFMSPYPPSPTKRIGPYSNIDNSVPSEKCTSKGARSKPMFLKMLPRPTHVYRTRQRENSSYLPKYQKE